jgi:hypothetical protein
VEDAWFCHKCGKPQRELKQADPEEVSPTAPVAVAIPSLPPPATDEIGFRNRVAVRVAVLCAGSAWMLAQVCSLLVLSGFWIVLWFIVAGFIAVYVYHRRTGVFLSTRSGARLGWLTGTFCFLIALVMFLLSIVWMGSDGQFKERLREQVMSQGTPNVDEALRMLESPPAIAVMVVFAVIFGYLVSVGLPMLGGILGAKVLEKE